MPQSKGGLLGLLIATLLAILLVLGLGWWNRAALMTLFESGSAADRGRPPPLVEVAPVQHREIEVRLQATGSLKAAETITITARSRGRVEALLFEEGDQVSRHQALVLLERDRALASVREAAARVSQTARQFERLQQLDAQSFVSETELEEARATASEARAALRVSSEDLADRIIEAPFDGLVGRRLISPGALLEPGTPVASLSHITPLDLLLDVPGTELARIQIGQRALATTPAYPEQTFEGRVSFVAPEVTEGTRTLALEATFDNADHRLKPGMFMTAKLVTDCRKILRVPEAAVIAEGPSEHLFVVETKQARTQAQREIPNQGQDEQGQGQEQDDSRQQHGSAEQPPNQEGSVSQARVRRQLVQTGIRRDGWIEITQGINPDERVAVAGLQRLRDGIEVRISGNQQQADARSSTGEPAADEGAQPSASPDGSPASSATASSVAGSSSSRSASAPQGDSP